MINLGRSAWKEESIREENEQAESDDNDWATSNEDTLIYPKGLSEKSKIGQAIGSSQLYMKVLQQREQAILQARQD